MGKSTYKQSNINSKIRGTLPLILTIITIFSAIKTIFNPIIISGDSMYPTYKNEQLVFGTSIYKNIERNDIVTFKHNVEFGKIDMNMLMVKRVIGLPGDVIEIMGTNLFINNQIYMTSEAFKDSEGLFIKLKEDEYFMLGDNYANSTDSRSFGAINKKEIKQKLYK